MILFRTDKVNKNLLRGRQREKYDTGFIFKEKMFSFKGTPAG